MASFKIFSLGIAGLFAVSAHAADVYSNDFSSNTNGFSGVTSIETAPNGQKFLGALAGGQTAELSLSGLAAHSSVTLSFDLYALNSLDGDGTSFCCGPDRFILTSGSNTLLNATFSNVTDWTQSYGGVGSAGGTGSDSALTGSLGYNFWGPDHTYHLSFTVADSASNISFVFKGASDQTWSDEGFGIDNVKVSIAAVPEPETYAMLLAGLGLTGLIARRRESR